MKRTCKHCGTPYRSGEGEDGFCCSGCAHVYALIRDEGLEGFYAQSNTAVRPVGDRPFQSLDFHWAERAQEAAEQEGRCRLVLRLSGMSCVGCLWLVEHLCRRTAGMREAKASLSGQMLRLQWEAGQFDLAACLRHLHQFGYTASESAGGAVLNVMDWRLLLCGLFALNSGILSALQSSDWGHDLSGLFHLLGLLCLWLSAFAGGAFYGIPLYRGIQQRRLRGEVIRGSVVALCTLLAQIQWIWPDGLSGYPGDWWYPVLMVCLLIPDFLAVRFQRENCWIRWHGWQGAGLGLWLLVTCLGGLAWSLYPVAVLGLGLLFFLLCICVGAKN